MVSKIKDVNRMKCI